MELESGDEIQRYRPSTNPVAIVGNSDEDGGPNDGDLQRARWTVGTSKAVVREFNSRAVRRQMTLWWCFVNGAFLALKFACYCQDDKMAFRLAGYRICLFV